MVRFLKRDDAAPAATVPVATTQALTQSDLREMIANLRAQIDGHARERAALSLAALEGNASAQKSIASLDQTREEAVRKLETAESALRAILVREREARFEPDDDPRKGNRVKSDAFYQRRFDGDLELLKGRLVSAIGRARERLGMYLEQALQDGHVELLKYLTTGKADNAALTIARDNSRITNVVTIVNDCALELLSNPPHVWLYDSSVSNSIPTAEHAAIRAERTRDRDGFISANVSTLIQATEIPEASDDFAHLVERAVARIEAEKRKRQEAADFALQDGRERTRQRGGLTRIR
jgi:hypothetical protein